MSQLFKEYSYPKNNYDFDYKTYIKRHYNPENLGVSSRPTISAFKTDVRALSRMSDGLMIANVPNANTVAGWSDVDPSDQAAVKNAAENRLQEPPYRNFRNEYPERDYPTDGIYSGSYFVQSGFCPVKSATTEEECKARDPNYVWMSSPIKLPDGLGKFFSKVTKQKSLPISGGNCFKPRYSYINNANDSGVLNGMLPGFAMEIADLNPGSFMKTMKGEAVMGYTDTAPPRFQLLPCMNEHFTDVNDSSSNNTFLMLLALISFIIVLIYLNI